MRRFFGFSTALLALGLLLPSAVFAEGGAYLAIGAARAKKSIVAFPGWVEKTADARVHGRTLYDTVVSDLTYMDLFTFLSKKAFQGGENPDPSPDQPQYARWGGIGADFLIQGVLTGDGSRVTLDGYLFELTGKKSILSKRYVAAASDVKTVAHTFANDIVKALTGSPGIFLTRIAMVCDRGGKKEIYSMGFDGADVRQVTSHRSIAFAPAWSPDGKKIVYSVFSKNRKNEKNIDLYEYDFESSRSRMLSNRKGINSGASYHPAGDKIALTMSFLGNPEIFALEKESGQVTRLTKSFGVDVDPAYSPDGRQIAFVSSRTGKSMIFKMSEDGNNPVRLTFAGEYNATPSWSPNADKIAFAGWIDRRFDVFIMNSDGSKIERLTKAEGNNEDPFFSPDGNFVSFSSNRTGKKQIYVMNSDGSFVRRLTFGLGECTTPKWSAAR